MTTTLTAARKSLLALVNTLPPNSTYADHAAVVADYLDNQVPLNIENKTLREQLAARSSSEGFGRIKTTEERIRKWKSDNLPAVNAMLDAALTANPWPRP